MQKFLAILLLSAILAAGAAPARAADEDIIVTGTHREIPATVCLPQGEGPFPFVVMYHGTGSNRNEAGDGYKRMAQRLAAAGIASARFDFAGFGDSRDDTVNYSLTSGMDDGNDVILYMQALDKIDADRVGLLGWSQGGTVAMLSAARHPGVRSLVTWAGATDMSGFAADQYEEAKANGYAVVTFDWREPIHLSIDWFDEVRRINIEQELAAYDGAVLALAGSEDTVVPPSTVKRITASVPTEAKASAIIEGADHTFNLFSGDLSKFEDLMDQTAAWFENTL